MTGKNTMTPTRAPAGPPHRVSGRCASAAAALIAVVAAAAPAFGHHHPIPDAQATGFSLGLAHPFSGVDHLLAMVAVGALAARRGGAALWALPGVFLTVMAWGVIAGQGQAASAPLELLVSVSAAALVAAVAFARRLPGPVAVVACGLIALAHGWVHGVEGAANGPWSAYVIGVLAGTALLHTLGLTAVAALRARAAWSTRG